MRFIQCGKPGLVVEVSHPRQEGSNRYLMCRDHVRQWQKSGLVVRILEGDDSCIPRRPLQFREKAAEYPARFATVCLASIPLKNSTIILTKSWHQLLAFSPKERGPKRKTSPTASAEYVGVDSGSIPNMNTMLA